MGYHRDSRKNVWVAYFSKRHPITKKVVTLRRQAKTQAEAKRLEKILILEVENKIRKKIIPSWKQVVEDYCFIHMRNEGIQEKTIKTYYLCLKSHAFDDWGDMLVDEITTNDIRDLIRQRLGSKSPSHQKNLLKFIRGGMNYALDEGIIQRNPSPKMKFKINVKLKHCLTEKQVNLFLNRAREMDIEWYPIWVTAQYTGMRNGELYALTWDKVNFETNQILVDCSWNNVDGFKST